MLGICGRFFASYGRFRLKRVPELPGPGKRFRGLPRAQICVLNGKNLTVGARTREKGRSVPPKLTQSPKSEAPAADDFAPECSDPRQEEGKGRAAQTARGQLFGSRIQDFSEWRYERVEMGKR